MAYAAVVSALEMMEAFMQSSQSILSTDVIQSIHEDICYLESFLKAFTPYRCTKLGLEAIEEQINDAMDRFEHLFESMEVPSRDPFVPDSDCSDISSHGDEIRTFHTQLVEVMNNIFSINQELEIKKQRNVNDGGRPDPMMICHLGEESRSKLVIGMDNELKHQVYWQTSGSCTVQAFSIVGMAGIGKTTLVQQLCNHPSIISIFDTRIMVRIGPDYRFREFLVLLLHYLGVSSLESLETMELKALAIYLMIALHGRRFLIVLDDVWDTKIWDDLEPLFQFNNSKSRFVFTTRLRDVAFRISNDRTEEKNFLSDEDAWNLLRETVFTCNDEPCTTQLEEIGKKIAKNCEGLPLAIILVGELLRKEKITIEYWEKVSEDDNPLRIGIDYSTPISKSIYLSYKMLPYNLKVCFLHIGVFPRDYEIFVAKLVRLWAVEGFLRPQNGESLEEIGEKSLSELFAHSVALICKRGSKLGKIKSCRIHVVFRNLCIAEARKHKFCNVLKKYDYSFPQGTNRQKRLCIHNHVMLGIKEVGDTMESISSVRSLLCLGQQHEYPIRMWLSFRFLRVLDALRIRFYKFPIQALDLIHLKYLTITCDGKLPKSISKLQNLEVLIMSCHQSMKSSNASLYFPVEIWSLKLLKHVECLGIDFPDPCIGCDDAWDNYPTTSLEHLITLSGVTSNTCTDKVLARIPNLKVLGVRIELAPDEVAILDFLGHIANNLHHLESFKCAIFGLKSQVILTTPVFPSTVRKLALNGFRFPWKDMAAISKLPNLQVLKLRWVAFCGQTWKTQEGEFPMLEVLMLEDLDIEEWQAEPGSFPILRRLVVQHCYKLREIPNAIAEIEEAQIIDVDYCNPSIVIPGKPLGAELFHRVHIIFLGEDHWKIERKRRDPKWRHRRFI